MTALTICIGTLVTGWVENEVVGRMLNAMKCLAWGPLLRASKGLKFHRLPFAMPWQPLAAGGVAQANQKLVADAVALNSLSERKARYKPDRREWELLSSATLDSLGSAYVGQQFPVTGFDIKEGKRVCSNVLRQPEEGW
jgi:hypothetical protein